MKYLCLLLGLCACLRAQAQTFNHDVWYDGKVVLEEVQDTLRGSLRFDLKANLLEMETGSAIKAYTARKVLFFEIYDAVHQRMRRFYSLMYPNEHGYEVPVFFELLVHGELTLLCREKLVTESVPMYAYGPYGYGYGFPNYYGTRNRIAFDFFFGFPNGSIKAFTGNRRDFFELVRDHHEDIAEYASERKLRYDERDDLAQIVLYYNSLKPN